MSALYEPLSYAEFLAMKPPDVSWANWLRVICGDVPPEYVANLSRDMIDSEAAYAAWLDYCSDVGL